MERQESYRCISGSKEPTIAVLPDAIGPGHLRRLEDKVAVRLPSSFVDLHHGSSTRLTYARMAPAMTAYHEFFSELETDRTLEDWEIRPTRSSTKHSYPGFIFELRLNLV